MHEAQAHELTSFITLTYSDTCLPRGAAPASQSLVSGAAPRASLGLPRLIENAHARQTHTHDSRQEREASLSKRDLQLFTKALNEDARRRFGKGVRYFACGEYGERTKRPHYHIALFGEDFSDDRYYWRTSGTNACYRSSRLESLWTDPDTGLSMGNSEIGELTIESAAYIASYVMKKVNGKLADNHYRRTCPHTGQEIWIEPEFARMSRGGRNGKGLAAEWFEKYSASVYPDDHVIHNGRQLKPPRYFDKLLERYDPITMEVIRLKRETRAKDLAADNTNARLLDKETVLRAKLNLKKKSLESQ